MSTGEGVGLRSTRGPILLALMLSIFLIAIDSTILSTAVPTITRELGGFDQFAWLFSVYMLAQAASVPVYGKLADTFGRKPIMIVGICLFLVGSMLCALSASMLWLIVFRAVQGIGAGAIMPTSLTIAGDIYTVRERATAQGYIATVWAVASVAGPTLGGVFAQFASWRWIFWVNIPIGLFALWLLWRTYHESFERHRRRIDYAGSVLLTGALVLLVLGVLEGGSAWAWLSWPSAAVFGSGILVLVAFVVVERRAEDPVLPFRLLRRPIVITTSLASLVIGVVMIGLVSFVPSFLESSAGAVPIVSGLAVATLTIGWPITGALAGRFYLRIGFRATAVIGASVSVVGAALVAVFSLTPSVPLTAVGCFVVGLGLGLVANPTLIAAQSSVEQHERGVVSGANALMRSVGSAVGVAALGAVANAIIVSKGGESPTAVQQGATAVFVGVGVATALLVLACARIPPVPIVDEPRRS